MFYRTRSGEERRLISRTAFGNRTLQVHALSNQIFRNLFVNGKQLTAPKLILTTPQIPEQDNQA